MRVYVSYPRVFGLLLLFLGEVEQQLKTTKVRIALKRGLHLPGVECDQFAAGLQKFIHESVLFHAITSSWRLRVVRLLLMHGSLCKPSYTTTPLLLSKQEKAHSEALDNGGNLFRRARELKAPKPEPLEAIVALSIFHIGLPLEHSSIPIGERPKIAKRLNDLQARMTRAGYKYEIIQASPDTGLDGFKHQLETLPCDGVLIGGGIAGNEAMSYFMEQIIEVTHAVVPAARIMFYNHSVDVREIVERRFGQRTE